MGLPMKYAAMLGKTGNGCAAYLPGLPGCIAAVPLERIRADRETQ